MREIDVKLISETVAQLCIDANKKLPNDLEELINNNIAAETSELAHCVMNDLADNIVAAQKLDIPICQDCGMAVVFIEIGQDVHLVGGDLYKAINDGVSKGYKEGYLRCSVVSDPLFRVNTGDNTPAVIHTTIVPGENVKITVSPKGFGSENMSCLKMFTPASDRDC